MGEIASAAERFAHDWGPEWLMIAVLLVFLGILVRFGCTLLTSIATERAQTRAILGTLVKAVDRISEKTQSLTERMR